MKANNNKEKRDEKKMSVRLDTVTETCLGKIMAARGLNQSDAIRLCIQGAKILQIGDIKDLAKEFFKIRSALESGEFTDEIKMEVNHLCQLMLDLMVAMQTVEE